MDPVARNRRPAARPQTELNAGVSHTREVGGQEQARFAIPGGQCTVKGPAASLTGSAGTQGLNLTGTVNVGSIECESSFERGGFKGTVRGTAALGAEVTAGTNPGVCVGVPMNLTGSVSHSALPGWELNAGASMCLGWPPAARPR